jgi:uncharacterized membrane protein
VKRINTEDLVQVCLGTIIIATPIGLTDEALSLATSLPTINVISIIALSLILNSVFIFHGVYEGKVRARFPRFILRTLINYSLTILTVTGIIYLLNIDSRIETAESLVKVLIMISFPASLAGAIIDSFDKE